MEAIDVVVAGVLRNDRRPAWDSIAVLREKIEGDRGMFAVEFDSQDGRHYRALYGVQREGAGWQLDGMASWSTHQAGRIRRWRSRPAPRGELFDGAGGWSSGVGSDEVAAYGGWPAAAGVAKVRLLDADGRQLEDDVTDGVALLMWSGPFGLMKAWGELIDAGGSTVKAGPLHVLQDQQV